MDCEHVTCSIDSLISKSELEQCCYLCSTVVKTKSNLKAHLIKTHKIVESPYDEAFLRKKKSKLHRIYHCPVENCRYNISKDKGVNKFSILKQHYNWVHMPHNFVCSSCNKTFGTAPALKYHEKKCGMRFACEICGSDFAEEKFLTYHSNRIHSKKNIIISSDKATNYEPTIKVEDIYKHTHVLQPIYIPIILPMNITDISMLDSLQESTKSSLELLHKLKLIRPDTKDQSTEMEPQCSYSKDMYRMCTGTMDMSPMMNHNLNHVNNGNSMINCVPYNWADISQGSGNYFEDNSRLYMSQCNASMQTMPHHYDNFYNVETQTNLAGFVGREFEDLYGNVLNEDLITSFVPDHNCVNNVIGVPGGGGGGGSGDYLMKLADNHTQTAKFSLDYVDLSDIETQTNLQELDDLLFKN